ncbi:GNAT family N-acetyltransferase [Arthrobacter pigmenti]
MLDVRYTQPDFTPDVYFTEGYGRVVARYETGTWITVSDREGGWQMPLVLMDAGNGLREAVSPYGYAGIHVGDAAQANSLTAWSEVRGLLQEHNVVSLFLRFPPHDHPSLARAERFEGLDLQLSGKTYTVDVQVPSVMWERLQGRARTAIRKAQRHEMTATVRPAVVFDFAKSSPFRHLYEETMRRVGAADWYFFDADYYSGLLSALGSSLLIAEVHLGTDVVASTLIMAHKDIAHYHLSGSGREGTRLGANALMIWAVLEWCAENGLSTFHMGGGPSEGEGLDKFKRSFGGRANDFFTGRYIVDHEGYLQLSEDRADSLGTSVADLEASGYFPAFRASVR